MVKNQKTNWRTLEEMLEELLFSGHVLANAVDIKRYLFNFRGASCYNLHHVLLLSILLIKRFVFIHTSL